MKSSRTKDAIARENCILRDNTSKFTPPGTALGDSAKNNGEREILKLRENDIPRPTQCSLDNTRVLYSFTEATPHDWMLYNTNMIMDVWLELGPG